VTGNGKAHQRPHRAAWRGILDKTEDRQWGGRKKGTPNKATTERQAQVAATGKTPLEIMLENARWAYIE